MEVKLSRGDNLGASVPSASERFGLLKRKAVVNARATRQNVATGLLAHHGVTRLPHQTQTVRRHT